MNYNAWTATATNIFDLGLEPTIEGFVCIAGTSLAEFSVLCDFTCALGYCPISACVCTEIGPQPTLPNATGVVGYPTVNVDYEGLCAFACNYGLYPSNYCSTVEVAVPTPTISPFTSPACTAGDGLGDFSDLCSWACTYEYCPIAACTCTATGPLIDTPASTASVTASFTPIPSVMAYDDLCKWTCSRGHCPEVCSPNYGCVTGTGSGNYEGLCDYSCGRGFCPDPCTCLANGTVSTSDGYMVSSTF